MIGKTLNHYKIVEKLGAGGMGEVYVAEDAKLNRQIALKLLPAEMAASPDRLERFDREAKAVAALNHPNIVTIYSIEKSDPGDGGAVNFLTMELVRGRTLGQTIPKGGMALGPLLDTGLALADAVGAAHDQGIVHRDLKPANVMVGDDGRVKILDFGLAKLAEPAVSGGSETAAPTREFATEEGKILGTVAYMSPEQAEGKPVTPRTDIFSLGVLLYEMATGSLPFKGDTKISLISSILREIPTSITDLNADLPRHFGRIIKRCLAKDPKRRYGNAGELHNELLELKEEFDSGELQPAGRVGAGRTRKGTSALVMGAVAVVTIAAATAVILFTLARRPDGTGAQAIESTLTQLTHQAGPETQPSLSPDGRMLVYSSPADGDPDIYFQVVGGSNVLNLTEDFAGVDAAPAFSPDGNQIAFRSARDGGGIFLMGTTGESIRPLTDFGYNPAWSPDGSEVLFSTQGFPNPDARAGRGEIWSVRVATGETRKLYDGGDAVQPSLSPDGRRIAFWGLHKGGQRDIWTISVDGGEAVAVTDDGATDWNPVWSPDGDYLYFSSNRGGGGDIWRVPIDQASGEVLGPPRQLTQGIALNGYITITADGNRLAYSAVQITNDIQMADFDPQAAAMQDEPTWVTPGTEGEFWGHLSPDGAWITYTTLGSKEDLFLIRPDGTSRRQLTDDPFKDRGAKWSPSGDRIAFFSDREEGYETYTIRSDGRGLRRLTNNQFLLAGFPVWSPDGARMVTRMDQGDAIGMAVIDPGKDWQDQTPEFLPDYLVAGNFFEVYDWSPDGKWLAGTDRSSQLTSGVVVFSFESGEYTKLTDAGQWPVWMNDNRRLLYDTRGTLRIVDRVSGEDRQLYAAPGAFLSNVTVSTDNTKILFNHSTINSDIWLLTLK